MYISYIVIVAANVKMGFFIYCALLFLLIMECCALTCRSEHGPKDEELKKIYNNCLKQHEGKKSENGRQSSENDWRNRENQWEKDNRSVNREHMMGNNDFGKKDRDQNKQHKVNNNERNYDKQNDMKDNKGMDGRQSNEGRENRMGNMNIMGKGTSRGRNDMTTFGSNVHLRGQDEFSQSEEYRDPSQNNYYSSVNPPRRYKRDKKIEMNSGQRSQYNPHSHRDNGNHDHSHANEGRNSSDNASKEMGKACVLHCFMENLHMASTICVESRRRLETDESGMPDRYLVTHALIKDEKNEDLLDFLQESIEECFQILDNENTEDKCEFAKNLLTCLSEKGRANCDDWSGKPNFVL